MIVDVMKAIEAGADPAMLGVTKVVITHMSGGEEERWVSIGTKITVQATNGAFVVLLGHERIAAAALTADVSKIQLKVKTAPCRYKYSKPLEIGWEVDGSAMCWRDIEVSADGRTINNNELTTEDTDPFGPFGLRRVTEESRRKAVDAAVDTAQRYHDNALRREEFRTRFRRLIAGPKPRNIRIGEERKRGERKNVMAALLGIGEVLWTRDIELLEGFERELTELALRVFRRRKFRFDVDGSRESDEAVIEYRLSRGEWPWREPEKALKALRRLLHRAWTPGWLQMAFWDTNGLPF